MATEPQKKPAKRRRRIRFGCLFGLLLFAWLLGLPYGLLRTSGGHAVLSHMAVVLVSAYSDYFLEVEGLSGKLPGTTHIERVTLYGAAGPVVEIEAFALDLSTRALWRRNLHIKRLHIESVTLFERPDVDVKEEDGAEDRRLPDLPDDGGWPSWLRVDSIRVARWAHEGVDAAGDSEFVSRVVPSGREMEWVTRIHTWRGVDLGNAPFVAALHAALSVPRIGKWEWAWRLALDRPDPLWPDWVAATGPTIAVKGVVQKAMRAHDVVDWTMATSVPAGSFNSAGRIDFKSGHLTGQADADIAEIGLLSDPVGQPLAGALRARIDLSGSLADLRLAGHLVSPEITWNGHVVQDVDLVLSLAGRRDDFQGDIMARLHWDHWPISLQATYGLEDSIIRLKNMDARVLSARVTGHAAFDVGAAILEGRLELSGTPDNPSAELDILFSDIRPHRADLWLGSPAQFSVRARLADRRLSQRFVLDGLPGGHPVELDLDMPLHVSLMPFELQWPPEGSVSGRFIAETDLRELSSLFILDGHRLEGAFSMELTLSGTAETPHVEGQLHIEQGGYVHERSGAMLRQVDVLVVGQQDHIVIERATATDGERGRAEVSGALKLIPAEQYPFEFTGRMRGFKLVRHDLAQVTGRADVLVHGNRVASKLEGEIVLSPAELRIPERLPAALIDLDLVEFRDGEPVATPEEEEKEEPAYKHRMTTKLTIEAPDRVFVRGRGLDSEWSGSLTVEGPVEAPTVVGSLSVLRGRFIFFGKRLALTRGDIVFDGSFPPDPNLDIQAESRSGGITANLRLSGPSSAPEIALSSSPPLPTDEILARLLFGRESARITPWQALTIARAVNNLRGGGSAFDFMGGARRVLRVDQIEVHSAEEGNGAASLRVGRYVGERVYVELERGIGEEGGRTAVEVELTPTIRLETEMGTNADAGLGLNWTWGY